MATKITVELPDNLYQRTQRFARRHQQDVEAAISALIEQGLAVGEVVEEIEHPRSDSAIARERAAYIALHPTLKDHYFGKYVAIFQGSLIDHDDDPAALASRIRRQHPDEFVLVTQVRQEPIRTIVVRSPRFVRNQVS